MKKHFTIKMRTHYLFQAALAVALCGSVYVRPEFTMLLFLTVPPLFFVGFLLSVIMDLKINKNQ